MQRYNGIEQDNEGVYYLKEEADEQIAALKEEVKRLREAVALKEVASQTLWISLPEG